jgi:hypothetical protein
MNITCPHCLISSSGSSRSAIFVRMTRFHFHGRNALTGNVTQCPRWSLRASLSHESSLGGFRQGELRRLWSNQLRIFGDVDVDLGKRVTESLVEHEVTTTE